MRTVSKLNKPFETFASNVGKLAFNMSDATEQTGLLSSKLTMSAGAWAGVASAALTAGLALKDYIERQREELRTRDSLTAEQRKAVDAARELTESYQENADSVNENVAGIEATYKAYKEQAARLTELANKQDKTKSDLSEMASLSETLESSMKGLNVGFNETTGSVELQGEALESLITSYENLAKAEATREFLTDAYKKQIEADMNAADAYEKRQEAYNQLTKAEQKQIEAKKRLDTMENDTSYSIEQVKQAQEEYDNLTSEVKQYSKAVSAATEVYTEYLAQQGIAARQIEKLTALQKEAEQGSEDAKKAAANYSEELKKQAETLDKLSEAYKKAESALSSYKSEISDLINVQKDLSEGTEYSTTQILDFLDKYPEMAEYIQKSAKGYTVEKEAIEELVNVKAKNLEMTARQAAEAKRAELSAKGVPDSVLSLFEQGIDSGRIKDIASVVAGQYTDEVQEYLKTYAKSKGIGNIYADILKDGIMEGAKAESETEKATKKTAKSTTKATKEEAEALVKIFKHRYNQGIIDAETYYKKLDEIAKEYYGNEAGYLERYMELEDEAQAGIKKAIEDKAKSYQTLEDKIEGVTEARKKLLGIESNKNVQDYDEATGFKLEIDKSAYAQASKNLYDAQRQLVTALSEMSSGGTGIYEVLGNKLADSTAAALESILPEMIDYESVPTTQNYTFNFGDIKTSGDAAAFRKLLNDFVNQVIDETQVI
jgi:chromosome segregation ATPase